MLALREAMENWSPNTLVKYGFSQIDDDGKIVSIWNFPDFDEALKEIEMHDEFSVTDVPKCVSSSTIVGAETVYEDEHGAVEFGDPIGIPDAAQRVCTHALGELHNQEFPVADEEPPVDNLPALEPPRELTEVGDAGEIFNCCPGREPCVVFTGAEFKDLTKCPVCNAARYKDVGNFSVPMKVIRHFPLLPRLHRMYNGVSGDLESMLKSVTCASKDAALEWDTASRMYGEEYGKLGPGRGIGDYDDLPELEQPDLSDSALKFTPGEVSLTTTRSDYCPNSNPIQFNFGRAVLLLLLAAWMALAKGGPPLSEDDMDMVIHLLTHYHSEYCQKLVLES